MWRMKQYDFPFQNQNPRFARKYEIKRRTILPLELFDDSKVEINAVLGERDNVTFIVRI